MNHEQSDGIFVDFVESNDDSHNMVQIQEDEAVATRM
jgi:hypothetical protein